MSNVIGIEWLGDVIVGAVFQGGHGGFDGSVAGHHDDEHVAVNFVHAPLQLHAVGAGHLDVD
jgi:hypothetical protein